MSIDPSHLIWIDLEMTGLDPETHRIIEIATVVTDKDLRVLAEGPVLAVSQPAVELDKMDSWCVTTHTGSGLVARVQASQITEVQAEQETLAFLQDWVPPNSSPMCGNSICQDRRFLYRHMPQLAEFFHYRNLDVSTVKELAQRWEPAIAGGFNKASTHLALADIQDSIAELRYYRKHFILTEVPVDAA